MLNKDLGQPLPPLSSGKINQVFFILTIIIVSFLNNWLNYKCIKF